MANIITTPVRAVGRGFKAAFSGVAAAAKYTGRGLTLVPTYLTNLLWILSQQFLDLARGGYGGNSAVYACLKLLSQSIPEPPLVAYLGDARAGELGRPLPFDHPLARLIQYPNELMTEYELWELSTLHLGITGRATIWKERDNTGQIIALWPLRPDRVGPIYSDSDQADQHVISGWSYLVPGTTRYIPIPRADVWMTNLPDPAGDSGGVVEGLGPLQVLASEVGADNEATRFVGSMLANYGTPGVILTTKNSLNTQADVDIIKASFRQEFGGVRRGSPGVLDADTTITQVGFSLQQLEFPALRRVAESRIAAAYGVPAILVGLQVGLDSGIRATIAEQREYFTETTLASYWRRYEDSFNRDVAAEFDERIDCRFDMAKVKALQVQDVKAKEKALELFQAGATSYNELRAAHGLPPFPVGGDRRVLPRGAVEIDENGDPVLNAPPVVPDAGLQETDPTVATIGKKPGGKQAAA